MYLTILWTLKIYSSTCFWLLLTMKLIIWAKHLTCINWQSQIIVLLALTFVLNKSIELSLALILSTWDGKKFCKSLLVIQSLNSLSILDSLWSWIHLNFKIFLWNTHFLVIKSAIIHNIICDCQFIHIRCYAHITQNYETFFPQCPL